MAMFRKLGGKDETELPAPAKLPPPVSRGASQSEKISKYISGLGSNLSPEVGTYLQQAQPCIQAVIRRALTQPPLTPPASALHRPRAQPCIQPPRRRDQKK